MHVIAASLRAEVRMLHNMILQQYTSGIDQLLRYDVVLVFYGVPSSP